jgi:hypothetical protein
VVVERYVQYQRLLGKTEIVVPAEGAEPTLETLSLRPVAAPENEMAGLGLTQREVDQLYRLNEVQGFGLAAGASSTLGGIFFVAAAVAARIPGRDQDRRMFNALAHAANTVASALNALAGYSGSHANAVFNDDQNLSMRGHGSSGHRTH